MDKFVTRTPSWKTIHYAPPQSSLQQSRRVGLSKTEAKVPKSAIPKQKPLQEKDQQTINSARSNASGRRLSIRDEKLLQIFCSQPNQPLVKAVPSATDEDSGLSSSSSTSIIDRFGGFETKRPTNINSAAGTSASSTGDENQPLAASVSKLKKHLGELSDYVNCEQTQSQLLVSQASSATIDDAIYEELQNRSKSPNNQHQSQSPYPNTTKANPQMARLHRDLQSPSASLRVRALKAMQSPHKSPYSHFDVPHDEQSIITAEERCTPAPAPTIQELMKNIVVYVEVRTGEDNRSAGVKKVISMLGARVNNNLLRDTTHVIFKDGLMSTYKKAKNWNIPVVSILWIEACKNKRMICNPQEFPISNIDRYENPELYDKMKRQKSMQPDSESNKRIRVKRVATSKDSNTKTVAETLKQASSLIGDTLKLASNKKTDISQYFKQLGSTRKPQQIINAEVTDTPKTPANYNMLTESPATQLINRMNSNCYTPIANNTKNPKSASKKTSKTAEKAVSSDSDVIVTAYNAKKKLNYWSEYKEEALGGIVTRRHSMQCSTIENATTCNEDVPQEKEEETPKVTRRRSMQRCTTTEKATNSKEDIPEEKEEETPKGVLTRRRSMQLSTTIENTKHSKKEDTKTADNVIGKKTDTPTVGSNRRRSSIHVTTSMCVDESEIERQSTLCTQFDAIAEEDSSNNANDEDKTGSTAQNDTPKRRIIRRRSTYTNKTMNVSKVGASKTTSKEISVGTATVFPTPNKRRRTLYTPQKMEETNIIEASANIEDSLPEPMPTAKASSSETASRSSEISITTPSSSTAVASISTATLTPFPMTIASSTLFPEEWTPKSASVAAAPSLLEEQACGKVFNSGRQPGRRRTLFDVSMDIISQRLQNINKSARLSIVAERPATSEMVVGCDTEESESILNKSRTTPDIMLNSTFKLQPVGVNQTVSPKSSETAVQPNEDVVSTINESEEPATPSIKKKRKLFVPNDNQWTPPIHIPLSASISAVKRRRTMMPLSTPSKLTEVSTSSPVVKPVGKKINWYKPHHRSSFAAAANGQQKIKQANRKLDEMKEELPKEEKKTEENGEDEKDEKNEKEKESEKKEAQEVTKVDDNNGNTEEIEIASAVLPPIDSNIAESEILTLENKVIDHQPSTKAVQNSLPHSSAIPPTKARESETEVKEINNAITHKEKKKLPFLVCTNMHKEQLQVIREAIQKLGGFHLAHFVTNETTHVVSFEPRRTLNLLRALVRGLWILDYSWVTISLSAGEWIGEEQFELKKFTRAVEICRAERQAFGNLYKCELFTDLGPFYVSSRCGPISKENLKELIELCGGKIVDQRRRARYILGDAQKSLEDKVYITPFWILDSITQMQVLRFQRYTYPTDTQLRVQKLQQQEQFQQQQQQQQHSHPHQWLIPPDGNSTQTDYYNHHQTLFTSL